jgi:hypothetical protein
MDVRIMDPPFNPMDLARGETQFCAGFCAERLGDTACSASDGLLQK